MDLVKTEINLLEKELTVKKSNYIQAIKSGTIHSELKIIFLEIKELEQKLKSLKNLVSEDKE